MFHDISEYCKSCDACQKSAGKKLATKAKMIPLPIIDVPLKWIAMDIVEPLDPSESGCHFILVICDYATRYPETVALKSIEAEVIAEELMKLFSRVGVPEEILTDQGSNFTSQLPKEVYRMLKVQLVWTNPYPPQTDGLCERFNQTLVVMLKILQNKILRIGTSSYCVCCLRTGKCHKNQPVSCPSSCCMVDRSVGP